MMMGCYNLAWPLLTVHDISPMPGGGGGGSTILHMYINEAWSATSHHKVASLSGTRGEGT